MPHDGSAADSTAAYLAEYAHGGEHIRTTQRERHGFLAFSLAASGFILSLLMRSTPTRSATEVCFLVGLAAGTTLVAERMTIRATQAISSAATYLRLLVEPKVQGLGLHIRQAAFQRNVKGASSGSRGFAFAYLGITAAFVLAWLIAPVQGAREWWQTAVVGVFAVASLCQIGQLTWLGAFGWKAERDAWSAIEEQEQQAAKVHGGSALSREHGSPPIARSPDAPRS